MASTLSPGLRTHLGFSSPSCKLAMMNGLKPPSPKSELSETHSTTLIHEDDVADEVLKHVDAGMLPIPLKKRTQHPELWYDDGTVILSASTTLFRVYRGILSRHSAFFKDAFSQPLSKEAEEEMDGVPVVHLHDNPDDLAHLLSAIFDESYYDHHISYDFRTVAAILRLSTKYGIPGLRKRSITHFMTVYPENLSDFDRLNSSSNPLGGPLILNCDHAAMITLAREANVPILLPMAFYFASADILDHLAQYPDILRKTEDEEQSPTSFYSHPTTPGQLSREDFNLCLIGRDRIAWSYSTLIGHFMTATSSVCREMGDCQKQIAALWGRRRVDEVTSYRNVFTLSATWLTLAERGKLCLHCNDRLRSLLTGERLKLWERLPAMFGLQEWEVLRESMGELRDSVDLRDSVVGL